MGKNPRNAEQTWPNVSDAMTIEATHVHSDAYKRSKAAAVPVNSK